MQERIGEREGREREDRRRKLVSTQSFNREWRDERRKGREEGKGEESREGMSAPSLKMAQRDERRERGGGMKQASLQPLRKER